MTITLLQGDCRDLLPTLADQSVQCCVTSPPYYGLRRYDVDGAQIGAEAVMDCGAWARRQIVYVEPVTDADGVTFYVPTYGDADAPCGECYVCALRAVFRAVRRVLRDDGTLWLNLGDSYAGNASHAHEGMEALGAQFAVFPEQLIEPCIIAGSAAQACERCGAAWRREVERTPLHPTYDRGACPSDRRHARPQRTGPASGALSVSSMTIGFVPSCACADNTGAARSVVLDPFVGSGTTCRVAERFGRDSIGIDLGYADLQEQRTNGVQRHMEGVEL